MFKTCAIASDDEQTRNEGCLQLAKALREVVSAEQDLQARNAAHEAGIVGKAIVSGNAFGNHYRYWHSLEYAQKNTIGSYYTLSPYAQNAGKEIVGS